jgi:hypothetical protein
MELDTSSNQSSDNSPYVFKKNKNFAAKEITVPKIGSPMFSMKQSFNAGKVSAFDC